MQSGFVPDAPSWLRDFVAELGRVNLAFHAATGREKQELGTTKNHMLSAATILLPEPLLYIRYQEGAGRFPYLFDFTGSGFPRAFHTSPGCLISTAARIVREVVPDPRGS